MKPKVPKTLADVWDIKEKLYQEVAHLPIEEALKKRLDDSDQTVKKLGLVYASTPKSIRKAS